MKKIPECLGGKTSRTVQRLLGVFGSAINNPNPFLQLISGRNSFRGFFDPRRLKQSADLAVYQNEELQAGRDCENDKQFPLETVILQSHNLKHDANLKEVTIHTGPAADEYTRSLHALAVTIATNIYFRDGAFKPESEEGRKTLGHELEHVAQYEEGRIMAGASIKELEREAEIAEAWEEAEDDPLQEVEIGGEIFHLRPSEHPEVIAGAVEMTKNWLKEQKFILEEEKYIQLLLAHAELKKRMI